MDYSALNLDGSNRPMRFNYSDLDKSEETIIFFGSYITENYEKEQRQLSSK